MDGADGRGWLPDSDPTPQHIKERESKRAARRQHEKLDGCSILPSWGGFQGRDLDVSPNTKDVFTASEENTAERLEIGEKCHHLVDQLHRVSVDKSQRSHREQCKTL